jgi:hypothetical protein
MPTLKYKVTIHQEFPCEGNNPDKGKPQEQVIFITLRHCEIFVLKNEAISFNTLFSMKTITLIENS